MSDRISMRMQSPKPSMATVSKLPKGVVASEERMKSTAQNKT